MEQLEIVMRRLPNVDSHVVVSVCGFLCSFNYW